MQPRVTAILVARNGATHLERTLEALRSQTRRPDIVIMVDCGSTDATGRLMADYGPTQLITAGADLNFGQAIATAVRVTAAPENDHEMLWLLAQDSAPEPGALDALLGELEIAASVAVAGPKVLDWGAGEYIHDFGESVTPLGATVTLVESELDQGQHDGMSDVLAVSAGGMLVRHTVWLQLGGFDPALPTVDDSLDFCIRVRLAGYRVSVVAAARVTSAGAGIAGPNQSSRGKLRRRRLRAERSAQLHRRLVYSPAWALLFHWLSLVPLALLRSLGQLLRKEPGAIIGEFSAAFGAALHGLRVRSSRKRFAATRVLGWASIATLRVPSVEVRRRHALQKEASLFMARGDRPEIRFFSGGGAWSVLTALVVGLAIFAPLLGASTLTGGGLQPLSGSPAELWANVGYGWRDIGIGFVGAADPFAAVLAVLGSLSFWNPSTALVLLYLLALPLASLGAWLAAARLTERGALRAVAAILWIFAPTFLSALAEGRPAAILVHLLLPWLFFAGFAAGRSWSASASAALLFAAIIACAPSLAPALLLIWLVATITSGRSVMRYIGIPLPLIALALPLVIDQSLRGTWLALLADPGVPVASTEVTGWQLLLGFPSGQLGGWTPMLQALGVPGAEYVIGALLAPIAILAVLALFLPGSRAATVALVTAVLGFGTAFAATHLFVAAAGATTVNVWAGSGLSLYWLGLIGGTILAVRGLRRFAFAPAVTAAILLVIVAAPLAAAIPLGTSVVAEGIDRTQPAFVSAEARLDPRVGTLQLTPQPDGGVLVTVLRGDGETLDNQSTLESTDRTLSAQQRDLADLAGNLVSRSGFDAGTALTELGVRFVVLQPAGSAAGVASVDGQVEASSAGGSSTDASDTSDSSVVTTADAATLEAVATELRTATALDANAALAPVGDTAFGRLWQHESPADAATTAAIPAHAGGAYGYLTLLVMIVVVGATVLLSIPTGAGREAVRQANRDAIRRASRTSVKQKKRFGRLTARRAATRVPAPVPDASSLPPESAPGPEPDPDFDADSDSDAEASDFDSGTSIPDHFDHPDRAAQPDQPATASPRSPEEPDNAR
ncbi:glycosyltransferase family 2 protein [Cryobacterium frigoriphilum]|uniref:Glycosyltransferase family 2 protein n=1 Tax=Cryobacterium frigoriphilum TaxID=1259150 RepID=A0A4R9A2C9_9MICO|nr:glycosyltransferase family 2 protein [Cryobacterium frigoriphilum]TFD50817.1 glycosyltransferase family 2 protein [Cryobacterium frigoriphilum]